MTGPSDPGHNPYDKSMGRARSRIYNRLLTNLKKVPGVNNVRHERSGTGVDYELVGDIDTDIFANGVIPCDDATVKANWWTHSDAEPPWFQFHYWDDELDCGWHRQPNDHVDGLDHLQYRTGASEEYEYETVDLEFTNAIGLLWEVVDGRLVTFLTDHYTSE